MNLFITVDYQVEHRYGLTNSEDYSKMTKLCVESFKKNLVDLFDVIVLTGKVSTYHQLFQEVYSRVKQIYFNNHCNILFADSDTICLRPVEIFGKFDKFSMFLIANEFHQAFGNERCRDLAKPYYPWFMANLRYYPSGIDNHVWDVADELAFNWIEDWAYDTIIYNAMFHSQGITDYEQYNIPRLNTLVVNDITDKDKQADIVHCAATRGSSFALEKMNKALGRN